MRPQNRLIDAIQKGDVVTAQRLLAEQKDVLGIKEMRNAYKRTFLHLAVGASQNQAELLKLLIKEGILEGEGASLVNAKDTSFHTPLHIAAYKGRTDCMAVLIGHQASLREGAEELLYLALAEGHRDCIKFLIDKGIAVNAQEINHRFLLHLAVKHASMPCLEIFIAAGADINAKGYLGNLTPLQIAIQESWSEGILFLIGNGAEVDAREVNHRFLLHLAVEHANMPCLEILIAAGADINAKGYRELTPLQIAIQRNWSEGILFLIDKGAEVNKLSSTKGNALHLAVERDYLTSCKALSYKVSTQAIDENGYIPLHVAAERGYVAHVGILINFSPLINVQTLNGNTALHLAAEQGHFHCVEILLSVGADPLIRNKQGRTPRYLAIQKHYTECVALLEKYESEKREGNVASARHLLTSRYVTFSPSREELTPSSGESDYDSDDITCPQEMKSSSVQPF